MIAAAATWAEILKHRDAIFFIDNDPAKDALVNGCSRSTASAEMVRFCRILCATNEVAPWFDRVASPLNISDGPSRGDCEILVYAGASRVVPRSVPELSLTFV